MTSLPLNNPAQASANSSHCFHCGEAIPSGVNLLVDIANEQHNTCCIGCQAAARFINDSGMSDFYHLRGDALADRSQLSPQSQTHWQSFDHEEMRETYLYSDPQHPERLQSRIHVKGMYCSACSWLITRSLEALPGIKSIAINPEQQRLQISFEKDTILFSQILMTLAELGYRPAPLTPLARGDYRQSEQRQSLKRLAVAGLGMMQVMSFAIGLYAGEFSMTDIDPDIRHFLHLVSLIVTTIVVFYAGRPFFQNALKDIRHLNPGMDVPVALAIGGAYSMSVYNTLSQNQHPVYFDSAVMFIFFLSLGRFLEMRTRHQASSSADALQQLLPAMVNAERGEEQLNLPPHKLRPGDRVYLQGDQIIPGDGILSSGSLLVDEALLTGESQAQARNAQDQLIGGSRVIKGSAWLTISHQGKDSVLNRISQLLDQSSDQSRQEATITSQLARYFVAAVLIISSLTAVYWLLTDPEQALPATLAVLVATCPCALSLAVPTALTAASNALSHRGVLVANPRVFQQLQQLDHWCFDKTGTLTDGHMSIVDQYDSPNTDAKQNLSLACALEQQSTHAIASAFGQASEYTPQAVRQVAGRGIQGIIDGEEYRLGSPDWIRQWYRGDQQTKESDQYTTVVLATRQQLLAVYTVGDHIRSDAIDTLNKLKHTADITLLSGDNENSVKNTAELLGIKEHKARLLPDEKADFIKALQSNQVVAMVGDGINDAPVLSQANVSIALATGSELAQSQADVILLAGRLTGLYALINISKHCKRIIHQNFTWSLLYNTAVLPLAVSGILTPWIAALGMSFSSLIVVLNANRLKKE